MREWTDEEKERAARQICKRRNITLEDGETALAAFLKTVGYHYAYFEAVRLQCQVNLLREALEKFLEGIDPDCGDPDCFDCETYRKARAALATTLEGE